MEAVIYRPIQDKDYLTVREIMNQSFGLFRYVSDRKALESFKKQYLYSCLAEATYAYVAEQNGKVIGVIMGHAENVHRSIKHVSYGLKTVFYSLKMMYLCRKEKSGAQDYKKLHEIYYSFFKKHKGEFDGVLTLFAVDESSRGLGVGKNLLSGLTNFLRENKTRRIYLYTDTTCNYGFYEHEGFKRLEEQGMTLTRDHKPFHMDVFLYSFTLYNENK